MSTGKKILYIACGGVWVLSILTSMQNAEWITLPFDLPDSDWWR